MKNTAAGVGTLLLMVAWPPVAAVLACWAMWTHYMVPSLDARPPLAVMDVDASIRNGLDATGSEASFKASVVRTETAAKKLRSNGYVVFNASNVYAYPSTYEVHP